MTAAPADPLEAALAAAPGSDPAAWERARGGLAGRAAAEGLVDVAIARHDTPLGPVLLGATPTGIVRLALPGFDEDAVLEDLARRVSPRVLTAPRPVLEGARRQLEEYFGGRLQTFDLALDWRLTTGFRREVLRATAAIPYGRTASYRDVATSAGSPRAVRAAGTALATNPLPIVLPCHRVLRSGGALGSYGGGVEAKAWLLALEGGRG